MSHETRGKLLAGEREWGRRDHDGYVRERCYFRAVPILKTFWWPHPLARSRCRLWARAVVGYRYFNTDGREVVPFWMNKS